MPLGVVRSSKTSAPISIRRDCGRNQLEPLLMPSWQRGVLDGMWLARSVTVGIGKGSGTGDYLAH
ncbi:hypothetical protein EDD52_12419 [Primorskyibacter sedentarius]|uniref:Uncharacterized protein n=1 Tax=Primorskyibacter sedentarius TaxID=745311 RepID=A0A4R3J4W2_9RHOB|nr:hypothetical protein EDD52_12419 [Primorskyibacter sedentarius]